MQNILETNKKYSISFIEIE